MAIDVEQRKKWEINPGSTVKVWQKIKEGDKFRLQSFEGLIITHKHGFESGATFTVRKISDGIGVERIFPLFSPNIEKVDLIRKSKIRRAKLYYIRTKATKDIRRKMKHLKAEGRILPKEKPAEETKRDEAKITK